MNSDRSLFLVGTLGILLMKLAHEPSWPSEAAGRRGHGASRTGWEEILEPWGMWKNEMELVMTNICIMDNIW